MITTRKRSVTATEISEKHGAAGDQTSISVTLAGPASPSTADSPDTAVTIDLLEHIDGEEVSVRTVGGKAAYSEGKTSSPGALQQEHKAGVTTWSVSFLLPGKLGDRQIVARAQEDRLTASGNGQPRYFGQVAIRHPVIPN